MAYLSDKTTETLYFACGKSSLGYVLTAASAFGVIAVLVRDKPEFLRQDLRECFPNAELIEGRKVVEGYVQLILAYMEKPDIKPNLSLDLRRGTEFQTKVWSHLLTLGVDEMTTYADVAKAIGAPRAMRAVGTTCASSHLSIVIPFHRVLNSKGKMHSSQHWSDANKRELIERELKAGKKNGAGYGNRTRA